MRTWQIITRNSDGSASRFTVIAMAKRQAENMAAGKIAERGIRIAEIVKVYAI